MRHLLLLLNAVLALVPPQKPSTRCLRHIARTATDPSPPAAAGAAPAKRPSRDRRLALAVEALENGSRDDKDAVAAKVDNLRSKAKGPMRTKLDGLRKRLDALGAPAAAEAAPPAPAPPKLKPKPKAPRTKAPAKAPAKAKARPRAKASNATRAPKKRPAVVAGAAVKGTVVSTTSYGAFVRLDGAKENSKPALLHVSEISDELVQDVAKTLPIGSRVEATVLSVDASKGFRVALSTKRQRKAAPKPIFEEEKAPVAKALKNLPGAPPSPALRLEQLADELSLDDLDALIEASRTKKRRKKEKRAPPAKPVEEEAQPAVPAATSLTAAFQSPERVAEQKRQEFELLMQDVVYESGSSLTDLRLLEGLRGKKKKGQSVFATGFWTKLFKPPPRPGRPPAAEKPE
jgi:predicted RNA-binding protein with RPS1 domain